MFLVGLDSLELSHVSSLEVLAVEGSSGAVAEGRAWGQVHTCGLCPKSKEESPELCWGWE